ncbi:MAG: DUF3344 domain-containing protein [Methanomicrobiaceae archaeon]|nr:DUF3344 domain-containing protein [Methanomicrobiaceae archaeon]
MNVINMIGMNRFVLTTLAVCMLCACITPAGASTGPGGLLTAAFPPYSSGSIPLESAGAAAMADSFMPATLVALEADLVAASGPASSSGEPPAASGYRGSTLALYRQGTLNGMLFSTAAREYTGLIPSGQQKVYTLPDPIPEEGGFVLSRLYLYTTWSHDTAVREGISASPAVFWNGKQLEADAVYSDRKGSGIYDYPVETFAFDLNGVITPGGNGEVTVVNGGGSGQEFAAYGVLLVIIVEDPAAPEITYWLCEGSDIIFADRSFGTTAADARTIVVFTGDVENDGISEASLLLVSTAASGMESDPHQVLFNGAAWDNPLTTGSSDISIAELGVLPMLSGSGNVLEIASVPAPSQGDYMENRNAVLVLTREGSGGHPTAADSSGNIFEWLIDSILAVFGIK